jgi:hypothetical protein
MSREVETSRCVTLGFATGFLHSACASVGMTEKQNEVFR